MRSVNRFKKPSSKQIVARLGLAVACGLALAIFLNASTARAAGWATPHVGVKEAAGGAHGFSDHLALHFRVP